MVIHGFLAKAFAICCLFFFMCSSLSTVLAVSRRGTPQRLLSSTIYVDDNNTQGPWDGTREHPYQWIQDGVDHSQANDSIFVFAGTYREHVMVNHSLTLTGEEKTTTIIDGTGSGDCVTLYGGGGSSLSGFTLRNSTGYYQVGLYLHNTKHNKIQGNIIEQNQNGIWVWSSQGSNIITQNLIQGNIGAGILDESSDALVTNNTIRDNQLYGYQGYGSELRDNRFENNTAYGIWSPGSYGTYYGNHVEGSDIGIMLSDNRYEIQRNTITGNRIGLSIDHALLCVVDENTFLNNTVDATFSFFLKERLMVPFIVSGQLVKWQGNYWEQPVSGPKLIHGTMILSQIWSEAFKTPGIPWTQYDFSPAQAPYPDEAVGGACVEEER